MRPFSLSTKFYIIFSLVFSAPASWLASLFKIYADSLSTNNFLHYLSSIGLLEAPTTIVLLLGMFFVLNEYIWKFYPIRKLFKIPNINGRYEGELTSTHTENNEQNGTYKIVIEIKQSLTKINVFLYTEKSCSYSIISSLGVNHNHNNELMYVYQNRTSAMDKDADMRDHRGVAFLQIFDEGDRIEGNYFNNPRERGRYGIIKIKKVKGSLKGKF